MRKIPEKMRREMADDPFYSLCMRRHEGNCQGRITFEHAFIYAGKQINEKWAIIPLCVYHHLGSGLDKNLNQFLALSRATPEDLAKYDRFDWDRHYKWLSSLYSL